MKYAYSEMYLSDAQKNLGLRKVRPSDGVYLIDIVRNPRLLNEIRL